MVTNIILGVVCIALLVYHFLYVKMSNAKEEKLMKAIMSKSLREYDNSEHLAKVDVTEKNPFEGIPEFISADAAIDDDEVYGLHLKNTQGINK